MDFTDLMEQIFREFGKTDEAEDCIVKTESGDFERRIAPLRFANGHISIDNDSDNQNPNIKLWSLRYTAMEYDSGHEFKLYCMYGMWGDLGGEDKILGGEFDGCFSITDSVIVAACRIVERARELLAGKGLYLELSEEEWEKIDEAAAKESE